jgi:phage protein U
LAGHRKAACLAKPPLPAWITSAPAWARRSTTVEAITYPQVIGGMDAVAWLIRHHEAQDAVPFIRLGSNYLGEVIGLVVVRNLSIDEDRLHPFTGVGRKVEVSAELLHVGST